MGAGTKRGRPHRGSATRGLLGGGLLGGGLLGGRLLRRGLLGDRLLGDRLLGHGLPCGCGLLDRGTRGGDFLATAFLAGAFFAGRLPASTASLNAFSGVTRTRRDALMRIASPVCGLRPMRAGRSTRANLAKPLIATTSPPATVSVIVSTNVWSAASALRLSVSSRSARAATSSLRFIRISWMVGGCEGREACHRNCAGTGIGRTFPGSEEHPCTFGRIMRPSAAGDPTTWEGT